MAGEGCENAANARVGSGDLKTIVLWPVVAGFLLVSGCSSGEMTTADGEAGTSVGQEATPSENSDADFGQQLPVEKHRIVEVLRAHVDHQNRDRRRCGIDTVVGHI